MKFVCLASGQNHFLTSSGVAGQDQLANVGERIRVANWYAVLRDEFKKIPENFIYAEVGAEIDDGADQVFGDGFGVEELLFHLRVRETEGGIAGGA